MGQRANTAGMGSKAEQRCDIVGASIQSYSRLSCLQLSGIPSIIIDALTVPKNTSLSKCPSNCQ